MKNKLGQRVKSLRDEYRLSQTDFSAQIGISYVALGNIERGATENPQTDTINNIINKFGTSYEWLIDGKGEMLPMGKVPLNKDVASNERVNVSLPWKDEAYAILKEQLAKKDQVIDTLSSILSRANFPQGLNESAPMQLMR